MQSIDLIEIHPHGTSKDPVSEQKIKCNNAIK